MEKRRSRGQVLIAVLLALNLLATGVLTALFLGGQAGAQEQYTLYIGTNDKDTDRTEIPFEECRTIVENTCMQYVSGATVLEARGAWTSDSGAMVNENTLICRINGATEQQIQSITQQLLKELNQSSILVERQTVRYQYISQE